MTTTERCCRLQAYETLVNTPGKDPATNPALPRFEFYKYFNLLQYLRSVPD